MSGVEVFALVASIFQVISFASDTIKLCNAAYNGTAPDKRLAETAASMDSLSASIQKQCKEAPDPTSAAERELSALAAECGKTAGDIKERVNQFVTSQEKGHSIAAMINVVAKYQWRRPSLKKLEKELESQRRILETKLLARTCSQVQANQILALKSFHGLDQHVQHFVKQYAEGCTRLEDLVMEQSLWLRRELTAHVTRETTDSTQSILKKLEEFGARMPRNAEEEEARRKRFLESLEYSTMKTRRSAVHKSHSGTFNWMLNPRDMSSGQWEGGIRDSSREQLFGGKKTHTTIETSWLKEERYFSRHSVKNEVRWDDFPKWLKSDGNLYWICGKPGSGKSTLVKFLVDSPLTQEALDAGRPATRIISHFFWKPGGEMQNSTKGVFCSLLHQLVSSDPALLPPLLEMPLSLESKTYHSAWSVEHLREVCFAALTSHPSSVCVFLDGLDEARDTEVPGLLRLVDEMSAMPKVKVCVSSRPEQRFLQHVQRGKSLRLEDLTFSDMQRFARHHLDPFLSSSSALEGTGRSIPDALAHKAQGVFLWLFLATASLVHGLDNRDQEEELSRRLAALPIELEDLYKDMWGRLNQGGEEDRQSTAHFLNLILDARALGQLSPGRSNEFGESLVEDGKLDLIHFMGATQPALQHAVLVERQTRSASQLDDLCVQTQRDVLARCAGFVEILYTSSGDSNASTYCGPSPGWEDCHLLERHAHRVPHFIHRTAYDFLVDTEDGREILAHETYSASDRAVQLLRGFLVKARFYGQGNYQSAFDALVLLHGVTDLQKQQEMFEFCWKWYDWEDQWYWGDDGWKPKAHFLSIATNFPRLQPWVKSAILARPNPSLVATTLLQDLVYGPWFYTREYITDKANIGERLKFVLSLGANPRGRGLPRPTPGWKQAEGVPHSIKFMTPLNYFLSDDSPDEEFLMDMAEVLFPAYNPVGTDANAHCPILVKAAGIGPEWYMYHCWGLGDLNKDNGHKHPRLCEFVLDINTEFAVKLLEVLLRPRPVYRKWERKRRERERSKQKENPWLVLSSFVDRLAAWRRENPARKPSVRVVAVMIPSLGQAAADTEPCVYLIRNKSMSDRLAAVIQRGLFLRETPEAVGQKLARQYLPQIDRGIRSGSKDYERLTGPLTDYLAEINCGYCFVDKDYQRVVKREDGSMVRVDFQDWDEEMTAAGVDDGGGKREGALFPPLWFEAALRVLGILLWMSAWLWPLRVPTIKRMRVGAQEVT